MLIEIQRMGVRAEPKAGVASGAEVRGFGPVGHCLLLRNVQGMPIP